MSDVTDSDLSSPIRPLSPSDCTTSLNVRADNSTFLNLDIDGKP